LRWMSNSFLSNVSTALFKLKGKKVLKYAHTYSEDGSILECGLIYARSDSDIDPFMEIWGIEGVSIGPLNAA